MPSKQKMNAEGKKYQVILADPPWEMVRSFGGANWRAGERKRPVLDYPTMSLNEIKDMPISNLADKNCNLYLWATQKYLPDVFGIIHHWGFDYIYTLVWCKPRGGFVGGAHFSNVEFLVYARKGKANIGKKTNSQWFDLPRGMHSKKPDEIRNMIKGTHPQSKCLELFSRQKTEGWDVWGNEVESDIRLLLKDKTYE